MKITITTPGDPSVNIGGDYVTVDFGDGWDPTDGDREERMRLAAALIEALEPYTDGKARAEYPDEEDAAVAELELRTERELGVL